MKSVLTHQQEKTEKYKNVLKNNKDIHIIKKREGHGDHFHEFSCQFCIEVLKEFIH